ncbi:hypothetical protein OAA09_00435 [bacterium]|nr:hypothetical protein [bacterium]
MSKDVKKELKRKKTISYLNKDFDGFRSDLLEYARTFFPDKIQDFSEASVGGMFMDMAAYVGDVMSFYLDHQFHELSVETAVERKNIERHLRSAGVEMGGASPAVAGVNFSIRVPSTLSNGQYIPDRSACPVVRKNTAVTSGAGITFILTEDIDFSEMNQFGELVANFKMSNISSAGVPSHFILTRSGVCVSGKLSEKIVNIGDNFMPFRKIVIPSSNITEIMSIYDSEGNRYYEVESLTQDTVFSSVMNGSLADSKLVPETLELKPAPYRYVRKHNLNTGTTTVQFGSGLAESLDDDVLPDPSSLSVPLYGKKTFSRFSIDPNSLLKTKTMGVSPYNTTITITYRHGGGLSHNAGAKSIRSVSELKIKFPHNPSPATASSVRASLKVLNPEAASGGAAPLTIDELKASVPAYRNSQSRIVTKQDLLARIYTMPSNFGRVFRAGLGSNPNNPLASVVYIISQDARGRLILSPDALKLNLAKFLNEFRLVSDAVDILDASVINLGVTVEVITDSTQNPEKVSAVIQKKLVKYFNIKNFQIDQPLVKSEIMNLIINTPGVLSLVDCKFNNISGEVSERKYSKISYNMRSNTTKGITFPPKGGIFEMRYPSNDIVIIAG